jgi:uncharacterized protein DUF4037
VFDWLATSTQALAEVTAGEVFHDGLGRLSEARQRLAWYPDDLWRYILACQWRRISQEEAFVGRCGEVGDELGAAVVAGRLVRDLMKLCLLLARVYPPYSKWLGRGFSALPCAGDLEPVFTNIVGSPAWRDRERHLAAAYEIVAELHNGLALTEHVDPRTRPYHDRPFRALRAERFTAALLDCITDSGIRALPLTGAIDQFVDSTDTLHNRALSRSLTEALYPSRLRQFAI